MTNLSAAYVPILQESYSHVHGPEPSSSAALWSHWPAREVPATLSAHPLLKQISQS